MDTYSYTLASDKTVTFVSSCDIIQDGVNALLKKKSDLGELRVRAVILARMTVFEFFVSRYIH